LPISHYDIYDGHGFGESATQAVAWFTTYLHS
jgi:hypothetical protein